MKPGGKGRKVTPTYSTGHICTSISRRRMPASSCYRFTATHPSPLLTSTTVISAVLICMWRVLIRTWIARTSPFVFTIAGLVAIPLRS